MTPSEETPNPGDKYKRAVPYTDDHGVRHFAVLDLYDVMRAWGVDCQALGHACKKVLQAGQRGHKSRRDDLEEAIVSIRRAIELDEATSSGL